MRTIYLAFCLFFASLSATAQSADSLYRTADVVFSGTVQSLIGGMYEDMGTEVFILSIKVDSIYKQRFVLDSLVHIKIDVPDMNKVEYARQVAVLNGYKQGRHVFYLKSADFNVGNLLRPGIIVPWSAGLAMVLSQMDTAHRLVVNNYYRTAKCDESCVLCRHIGNSNWKKVKEYMEWIAESNTRVRWMAHRGIKWAQTDRAMNASLPSYYSTRFMFLTSGREVPATATYRLGYVKTYSRWVPIILYGMFHVRTHKYFTSESLDATQLLSLKADVDYHTQYFGYEQSNYQRLVTDTALVRKYGANMPLSMELAQLASVFDGEFRLYLDHQTMDDYLVHAEGYVHQLESEKKLYLLSITATHTLPTIGGCALSALGRLNDVRAVPWLLQLADWKCKQLQTGVLDIKLHTAYLKQLCDVLNKLTGCIPEPLELTMQDYDYIQYIREHLPIWARQIKVRNTL